VTEKIGKYEIRLPLGRGGMGVVYEGFDPAIGRRVAIKTLRTENIDPDELPEFLARFKREAQSAGRLSHPHIVTIYEYGEQDGMPYIVMEYVAGRDLSVDLKRGVRFGVDEVVRLMTQLLGALGHAHEHGVVHRDIKPQNILLLEDGSLKVVDFGIARLEDGDSFTKTGLAVGTPAYMAPEQVMGQKVTPQSDLFSCGTLLYQLLTGDRPFTGDEYSVKQKILKLEPVPPSELNPLLLPPWDAVVARAMAKKPEARFDNARQFLESIRAAQEAEKRDSEEARRKRIEAEEHARRSAEARSAEEARKREEAARREIERKEREEATQRQPETREEPAVGGMGRWVAAGVVVALLAGGAWYFRQGAEDQAAKADAARVVAESLAKEESAKRERAEALVREESDRRTKLEGEVKQQAELAEKARLEVAREAALEKGKFLALTKEEGERRKAELIANKEAEVRARVEVEAKARAEAEARLRAEMEAKAHAEAEAKREVESKTKDEERAKLEAELARKQANSLTRYDGIWFGIMKCGVGGDGSPGYEARATLDVIQGLASLVRNTKNIYEELSGKVSGRDLILSGRGYWHNDRKRAWSYQLSGHFSDATFDAKGTMYSPDGSFELRRCSMQLVRK
jgi:tRNA A-37 threonylcarbamoyl transferase component Bud32